MISEIALKPNGPRKAATGRKQQVVLVTEVNDSAKVEARISLSSGLTLSQVKDFSTQGESVHEVLLAASAAKETPTNNAERATIVRIFFIGISFCAIIY